MKSNLCRAFFFDLCVLVLCCVKHIDGRNKYLLKFLCQRPFLYRRIERCKEIFPCLANDAIQSNSDLQNAIKNVPPFRQGNPITVLNICNDHIKILPTFETNPATDCGTHSDARRFDYFGFKIEYQSIRLQCKSSKSFCIFDAQNQESGIFYLNNATLLLNGFHLVNGGGISHTAGGAILMTNFSTLDTNDTDFINNSAECGGAIKSDDSRIGINNNTGTLEMARSNRFDRDAELPKSSGNDYSANFIQNKAKSGGAIYSSNTIITGSSILFDQNEASQFGGALGLHRKCTAALNNVKFSNNYAAGDGGAIHTTMISNLDEEDVGGGLVTLDRIDFVQNTARNHVSCFQRIKQMLAFKTKLNFCLLLYHIFFDIEFSNRYSYRI